MLVYQRVACPNQEPGPISDPRHSQALFVQDLVQGVGTEDLQVLFKVDFRMVKHQDYDSRLRLNHRFFGK